MIIYGLFFFFKVGATVIAEESNVLVDTFLREKLAS